MTFFGILRTSTQTDYLTWKWAQEGTRCKLTCIMDRQVCKSFIQPANGGAPSWATGVGLSKISVDTEAVAIGYWNNLSGIFRLKMRRCLGRHSVLKCNSSVYKISMFVIFLFLIIFEFTMLVKTTFWVSATQNKPTFICLVYLRTHINPWHNNPP